LPLPSGLNLRNDEYLLKAAIFTAQLETVRFVSLLPRGDSADSTVNDCHEAVLAAGFLCDRDEMVAFLCRLGAAEGFPRDVKSLTLRKAVQAEYTSVVRSLCSLPASVGLPYDDLHQLAFESHDAPGTARALYRALAWHTLLWRNRWPVLALRELRGRGHATAKARVAQPYTRTQCHARLCEAPQPVHYVLKRPRLSRKRRRP